MNWIAGYVLLSIGVCLLTVAAHDIGKWLATPPWTRSDQLVITWTMEYPTQEADK